MTLEHFTAIHLVTKQVFLARYLDSLQLLLLMLL